MTPDTSLRPRPYWHVDAKWISGLLLTFVLGMTLVDFSLVQATAEKPAVDTLTLALAVSFSPNGLDNESEIAEMMRRLDAAPNGEIQPLDGLSLTIRREDIAGLTPRQARLFFFRQLAAPIYRGGAAGLAGLATNPEMRQAVSQGVGPLTFFSLESHQRLGGILTILVAISLALALPLIYFSFGIGRLTSPGCVLVAASLPGAALLAFLGWGFRPPTAAPGPEADMTARLGGLATEVLPPMAQVLARGFLIALAAGVTLLILSFLGRLVRRSSRRRREASPRTDGGATA